MKLGEFCVVILVMIMFMQFMGLDTGLGDVATGYGFIIGDGQLESADIESSTQYSSIFGIAGILVLLGLSSAVIVGFFTRSFDTSLVILPLVTATATLFARTFWLIISHVQSLGQSWATNMVTIIMGGIGVAFIWSAVDYFANR